MVKDANFTFLIDLINPYLPDAKGTSKEETVRLILKHASNGKYDPMPEPSTLNKYATEGITRTAAKKILKLIDKESSSLEGYFRKIGEDQLTFIANKLKKSGISSDVYRSKVPSLLAKLFNDEFDRVASRKNKRKQKIPTQKSADKIALKDEKSKFDIRSGAHQFIGYEDSEEAIDVDGVLYKVSPHLNDDTIESETTLPYCAVLFEAYTEKGQNDINSSNIESSRFVRHFRKQQKYFNEAAWYEHSLRDNVIDFEKQYDFLKEDIYEGIEPVYHDDDFGTDGVKRLGKVQQQVVSIQLDKSNLKNIDNMLGNDTKKGLCHVLVNDKKIKSWVNIDYDEII